MGLGAIVRASPFCLPRPSWYTKPLPPDLSLSYSFLFATRLECRLFSIFKPLRPLDDALSQPVGLVDAFEPGAQLLQR